LCGVEATHLEIEQAISYFQTYSKEQESERKIMQSDLGQEGYVRGRGQIEEQKNMINFRNIESLLRMKLQKAGYK